MVAWLFSFIFPHFGSEIRYPKGGGEFLVCLVAGGACLGLQWGALAVVF